MLHHGLRINRNKKITKTARRVSTGIFSGDHFTPVGTDGGKVIAGKNTNSLKKTNSIGWFSKSITPPEISIN
jgi:hypothetical protein